MANAPKTKFFEDGTSDCATDEEAEISGYSGAVREAEKFFGLSPRTHVPARTNWAGRHDSGEIPHAQAELA